MNGHWSDVFFNIAMSLIGGLVKAATSKNTRRKKLSRFVTSAIVGGFAGVMTYMLCSHFNWSWQMTSFATGIAGYMGDSILELFSEFLPKLLTGKITLEIKNIEKESKKDDE